MKLSKDQIKKEILRGTVSLEQINLIRNYHTLAKDKTEPEIIDLVFYTYNGVEIDAYHHLDNPGTFRNHFVALLYLIELYIRLDCNAVRYEYYGDTEQTEYDLYDLANGQLEVLLFLLKMEDTSEIKLTLSFESPKSDKEKRLVKSHDLEFTAAILKNTIPYYFNECKKSPVDLVRELLRDIEIPTVLNIEPLLRHTQKPIKPFKLKTAFQTMIVLKIRDYLNAETEYKQGTAQTLSKEQAKIIYALLVFKDLVEVDLILNHRNDAARIKYVRAIISNSESNKGNIEGVKNSEMFTGVVPITDSEDIDRIKCDKAL